MKTCCFCGQEIHSLPPEEDARGRIAHWACSHEEWKAGRWVARDQPVWAIIEDGDDDRAAFYLNGGTDERSYA